MYNFEKYYRKIMTVLGEMSQKFVSPDYSDLYKIFIKVSDIVEELVFPLCMDFLTKYDNLNDGFSFIIENKH
jgi:hypothetical protein